MLKVSILLSMSVLLSVALAVRQSDDRIDFAFELVRHGARAPDAQYGGSFKVGENQLTAEGMRQRYLLGAYHRQRYVDEYGLLSEEYDPEEIFMTSTDVNRTIQSGYSELMGLYPPGATLEQISEQVRMNLLNNGIGLPPFRVRDADVINQQLGSSALPHDIASIPIMNNIVPSFVDDVEMDGCSYSAEADHANYPDNQTYEPFEYLIPLLREPMKINFNLTDEEAETMDYLTLYGMADAVQSQTFEGIQQVYNFTEEDIHNVNMVQVGTLILPLQGRARNLWISKMLRTPLTKMEMIVKQTLASEDDTDDNDDSDNEFIMSQSLKSKFEIFSAHDYTVSAMVEFFNATNGNFTILPFASQINIELHHSESCLSSDARGEQCFSVETRYNGMLYEFPTCDQDSQGHRTVCSLAQFKEYLNSGVYIDTSSHFVDECAQEYNDDA